MPEVLVPRNTPMRCAPQRARASRARVDEAVLLQRRARRGGCCGSRSAPSAGGSAIVVERRRPRRSRCRSAAVSNWRGARPLRPRATRRACARWPAPSAVVSVLKALIGERLSSRRPPCSVAATSSTLANGVPRLIGSACTLEAERVAARAPLRQRAADRSAPTPWPRTHGDDRGRPTGWRESRAATPRRRRAAAAGRRPQRGAHACQHLVLRGASM